MDLLHNRQMMVECRHILQKGNPMWNWVLFRQELELYVTHSKLGGKESVLWSSNGNRYSEFLIELIAGAYNANNCAVMNDIAFLDIFTRWGLDPLAVAVYHSILEDGKIPKATYTPFVTSIRPAKKR